jgi:hypothetical protein
MWQESHDPSRKDGIGPGAASGTGRKGRDSRGFGRRLGTVLQAPHRLYSKA